MLRIYQRMWAVYTVEYDGKNVGDFIMECDGYFAWWPALGDGYLEAHFLRAIADRLDSLNQAWDEVVQRDLGR